METRVLKIEGMNCSHCQEAVESALTAVSGVESAAVNLEEGSATVTFNAAEAPVAKLKAAVESAGYKVVDA